MAHIAHTSRGLRMVVLLSMALLALVLPPAAAQLVSFGKCPEKDVVQNFSVSAYLGKWYEQKRYITLFELGGKCVTANYTDAGDGKIGVHNALTYRIFEKRTSINATATLVGKDGEAKLVVRFPAFGNFPAPYWVLDTDYTNYAIVWTCVSVIGLFNTEFAWVLTRAKNPGEDVMAKVTKALNTQHLNELYFIKTSQDCDYN